MEQLEILGYFNYKQEKDESLLVVKPSCGILDGFVILNDV